MKQTKIDDLKRSEAQGHIKTLEEEPELPVTPIESTPDIDQPDDFRIAIGNAQMEGADSIEVTERLFKYLVKNSKSRYITYGNPGIKVFMKGTRDEIEREESMSAEAYGEHMARKRMNASK